MEAARVLEEERELGELRAWLKSLRQNYGVSIKSVAEEVGVDRTTLSRFVNSGYKPGPEILQKLARVRERIGGAAEAGAQPAKDRLEFVLTQGAANIQALCHECRTRKLMGLVVGYSGAGKTTALRHYRRAVGPDEVVFVTCDPTFTMKELLREIARAMGVGTGGTARNVMRKIVASLIERPRLLIVDEANQLVNGDRNGGLPKVNVLRSIYDEAGTIGVVLSGTPELLAAVLDGPPSLAQLRSRLRRVVKLEPPSAEDAEKLLSGFRLDREARAILAKRARDTVNGGLRWLETTIHTALDLVGPEEVITADVLAEADALTLEALSQG